MDNTFSGRHHVYAATSRELSETEIARRFGDVLNSAATAFETDPSYYVEMTSSASNIIERRETTSARREALYAQEGSTLQEATQAALERRRRP